MSRTQYKYHIPYAHITQKVTALKQTRKKQIGSQSYTKSEEHITANEYKNKQNKLRGP
jgi:hypothetical protein